MNVSILNQEFGAGEIDGLTMPPECASSPDLPVPHFLDVGDYSPAERLSDPTEAFIPEDLLPTNHGQPPLQVPTTVNPWPPQLVVELALQLHPLEDILSRHSLAESDYQNLLTNLTFRREVATTIRELSENGQSFKLKARMQAEAYLEVVDDIVNDLSIAASTRMDAIKYMTKCGDLEPRDTKDIGNATQVNVNISF